MMFSRTKTEPTSAEHALPGRADYLFTVPTRHRVTGHPIQAPFSDGLAPDGLAQIVFGLGCFWGAEEIFWQLPGVWTTAVGFAGGSTPHPTYEEVCTGRTGHTESVLVVFDPAQVELSELIATFFEVHDPTQGMRQGNDVGSQYRSAIYYSDDAQREIAERAAAVYGEYLKDLGYGTVTTEIAPLSTFYYAEPYHQQYLATNPNGYRCHSTTGAPFPRERLSSRA